MVVEIRVIAQDDEAGVRAWWEPGRLVAGERAVDVWPPWESACGHYVDVDPDLPVRLGGADDGARLVGAARVDLPVPDTTHPAVLPLFVDPGKRRGGIGTGLALELRPHAEVRARLPACREVLTQNATSTRG